MAARMACWVEASCAELGGRVVLRSATLHLLCAIWLGASRRCELLGVPLFIFSSSDGPSPCGISCLLPREAERYPSQSKASQRVHPRVACGVPLVSPSRSMLAASPA